MAHVIRRALGQDAAVLSTLMHGSAAYEGEYARILEGYQVTAGQVQRDRVFLAEDGCEVLGFYSLANVDSEPELDLLFVADSAQGMGVGSALFEHMRNTAGFASCLVLCSALTLSSLAAIPASLADARALKSEEPDTDHFTVWCKVWVSEDGIARTVEILKVEPHTDSDAAIGTSVKQAVLTWMFTPRQRMVNPSQVM